MDKTPDANKIMMDFGIDGLRTASDNARTITAEDLVSTDPIGAIGANGSNVTGIWDEPDLSILGGPSVPAPVFPLDILGPYWEPWCAAASKAANAPVDYVTIALLTTAAGLIGNARTIAPTPNWHEPCILWSVLVGTPSSGKSPALDPLTRIVTDFESEMARDFELTRSEHLAKAALAEQKRIAWKVDTQKALKAGKATPTFPADAEEPELPKRPRIMLADTTMEAAADIASANPKGLLLIRDELGGWWRGFDRYGGDGERQFWIQAYGGRSHTVDRKKLDRPIHVQRLSVSILGGTQPDVLAQLLKGEEDGFTARCLFCFPDAHNEFKLESRPTDTAGAHIAMQRLRKLALLENGKPLSCTLNPDAATAFESWLRDRHKEAHYHSGLLAGWLGKSGGLALRIALVLEHLWWSAYCTANSAISAKSPPEQISLKAIKFATSLIDSWAKPMARRAFGALSISHQEADATYLANWLKNNGVRQFNARDVRRSSVGPSGRLSDPKHMNQACEHLVEAGLIRFIGGRVGSKAGRARLDFEVNPALLGTD